MTTTSDGVSAIRRADDPQHIEGRLVGPVRILDHEHRRDPQLLEQGHRDVARVAPGLDRFCERPAELDRNIGERPERRWGGEMLTRPGERASRGLRDEGTHERCLADPGFTPDEDNRPPVSRAAARRSSSACRSTRAGGPPEGTRSLSMVPAILRGYTARLCSRFARDAQATLNVQATALPVAIVRA